MLNPMAPLIAAHMSTNPASAITGSAAPPERGVDVGLAMVAVSAARNRAGESESVGDAQGAQGVGDVPAG